MSRLSVVIPTPSGLSGDMLLAGLSRLAEVSDAELDVLVDSIGIPDLANAVRIVPHSVNGVTGWHAQVTLPHEHHHRTYASIAQLIRSSALIDDAKNLAMTAVSVFAEAEARVHSIPLDQVHFHEVGALDSIIDTCLSAALLVRLAPANLWCSPLPICDGTICCAHGLLSSPAPAGIEMLGGIPIYGVPAEGETVTPAAIAFLKAASARFGNWPQCEAVRQIRVYGAYIFKTAKWCIVLCRE